MNYAASLVDGRHLTPDDQDFVSILLKELDRFQLGAPRDRALMFEPLHGFQRYLIHKVTESFPRLTSFSINDERGKRTVVCFRNDKKKEQNAQYQIESINNEAAAATRGRKSAGGSQRGSYPASTAGSASMSRNRDSERSRPSTTPRPLRHQTSAEHNNNSRASSRSRRDRSQPRSQHAGAAAAAAAAGGGRSLSSHSSPVRTAARASADQSAQQG